MVLIYNLFDANLQARVKIAVCACFSNKKYSKCWVHSGRWTAGARVEVGCFCELGTHAGRDLGCKIHSPSQWSI